MIDCVEERKLQFLLPSVAFLIEEVTVDMNRLHPFFHRFSKGGIESICTRCFLIVAKECREGDLEKSEQNHICDSVNSDCLEYQPTGLDPARYGRMLHEKRTPARCAPDVIR